MSDGCDVASLAEPRILCILFNAVCRVLEQLGPLMSNKPHGGIYSLSGTLSAPLSGQAGDDYVLPDYVMI